MKRSSMCAMRCILNRLHVIISILSGSWYYILPHAFLDFILNFEYPTSMNVSVFGHLRSCFLIIIISPGSYFVDLYSRCSALWEMRISIYLIACLNFLILSLQVLKLCKSRYSGLQKPLVFPAIFSWQTQLGPMLMSHHLNLKWFKKPVDEKWGHAKPNFLAVQEPLTVKQSRVPLISLWGWELPSKWCSMTHWYLLRVMSSNTFVQCQATPKLEVWVSPIYCGFL